MRAGTWTVRAAAEQDVDEISLYIARDNPHAAERFIRTVRENFDLLARFPRAGQRRRAQSRKLARLRTWPIGGAFRNYLIVYLERKNGVEIVRVVHGMRDVERMIDDLDS